MLAPSWRAGEFCSMAARLFSRSRGDEEILGPSKSAMRRAPNRAEPRMHPRAHVGVEHALLRVRLEWREDVLGDVLHRHVDEPGELELPHVVVAPVRVA